MDLPTTTTTLFGREDELEQIALHLDDPFHRLVTLVGPGGIGKTRLGLEAAHLRSDRTKDGAVFVDLQAIDVPDLAIQAIADSLQISIASRDTAVQQIAQFLADKETLLFIDNFEQVVDAAPLVSELLNISPGTTALVTSRVPLRISQEWLLYVDGLPVPQPNRPRSLKDNASRMLFMERAQKVRPDLLVSEATASIERICRLVDGMPLAIEIAASWAGVLDCSDIAEEIEKNQRFLQSGMRDVPERHRSIQIVFEQSMQLLSSHEKEVFERLSIFKGGFTRDAAEIIAGADLQVLSSLVERSLIRSTTNGRYRIHELVRQFGADQLAIDEQVRSATEKAHSRYYMDFLAVRHSDICVVRQVETAQEVEIELENIRAAWNYAVDHVQARPVADAAVGYAMYIQFRGRYAVGGQTFTRAVKIFKEAEQTPEVERALAIMLIEHGWFNLRQGHLDESEQAFTESVALHQSLNMNPIQAFGTEPQLGLAYVESTRGDIKSAIQDATEALNHAAEQQHDQHWGMANQLLGHLALREGRLEDARRFDQAALDTSVKLGERWFMSYCLNELGEVAVSEGKYDEANDHFRESLKIAEDFGDRANIGLSQVYLGEVASLAGRTKEAQTFFEDSKVAYMQLGDRGGTARADSGLGILAVSESQFGIARKHLQEVLDISIDMQFAAMMLDALEGIGELALKTGMEDEGRQLLFFVDQHSSTESRTRARLRLVRQHSSNATGPARSMEEQTQLARRVLEKVEKTVPADRSHDGPTVPLPDSSQPLPESLTEREREVLSLIAQGLPNKQIADGLIVSLGTVKWYSNQIYMKLGVHNRTSAVAKAHELGVLDSTK